jgi:hypothetical protein
MSNKQWKRLGAAGGIAYVVLQLVSQALIQIGGSEPAFAAPADEIVAFFVNRDPLLAGMGGTIAVLSVIPFLWFIGILWAELQRYEEKPAWMSAVAFASGIIVAAVLMTGSGWELAVFRVEEGLSPEMARTLFDQGNFMFATLWVAAAALLLASSIVGLKDNALPRWLSWFGLLTAVGLLAARAFWAASAMAFLPYVLFWVWLIAASILLMRRMGAEPASVPLDKKTAAEAL